MLKPNKALTIKSAIELTPQYVDLLCDLKNGNGRSFFSPEISVIQNDHKGYVLIYDNELKIGRALFLFILGDDGFKDFLAEIETLTPVEQQSFLDDMANPGNDLVESFSSCQLPQNAKEWKEAREASEKLSEDEKKEARKRGSAFWCFLFSSFFNTLALMVHGSKMTTLVPQAIEGNDDTFLKAIQIDRMLLIHHPYFRDRKFKAQNDGDTEFLAKIAYRESNSPLRGKIRYPALFMLFGILESF